MAGACRRVTSTAISLNVSLSFFLIAVADSFLAIGFLVVTKALVDLFFSLDIGPFLEEVSTFLTPPEALDFTIGECS